MIAEPAPDPNSPRAAATYLVSLRPLLAAASGGRRAMVRSVRALVEDVRRGKPPAARAQAIGAERLVFFEEARRQLDAIVAPVPCEPCRQTFARWLDRMADASRATETWGITGDAANLDRVQRYLREAQALARAFNAEHAHLVELMREMLTEDEIRTRLPLR